MFHHKLMDGGNPGGSERQGYLNIGFEVPTVSRLESVENAYHGIITADLSWIAHPGGDTIEEHSKRAKRHAYNSNCRNFPIIKRLHGMFT